VAREPISIVQIDQDLCEHSFGAGACGAGTANALRNSSDITDASSWTLTGWSGANGDSDPDGGTGAWLLTRTSGVAPNIAHAVDVLAFSPSVETWHSGYVKTNGTPDKFFLIVSIPSSLARIDIDLTDGSHAPSNIQNVSVTDEGAGWYKFEFSVSAENAITGAYYFGFDVGGGTPATGQTVSVYGLQVSTRQGQSYLATAGAPIINQSGSPCFNTRQTCQAPSTYSLGDPLELKFVSDRSPQMRDDYYLPSLQSVRIGAAKLNPGGGSASMSPFGTRATLSATFRDHPHTDQLVDPYAADRDYDPMTRGSFWSKWRARNPYYMHRPITFTSGYYVNGALTDAVTRQFVITDFSGPDSDGRVTISGKDILTLAEGGKAQAPAQSTGELSAAIDSDDLAATLAPAGIGDIEYPASGFIRIGKEVIPFTRSGDALTFSARGTNGTTADDHDEGANVQLCLQYTSQSPHDILEDLLLNYANIPAGYLDTAQWEQEAITDGFLPYLYSALITEPESVSKLIGELCEQM
jgi:hypothetical protein